jgi:hypothetical protein
MPTFIALYMAEKDDPWRSLSDADFDLLDAIYIQACGEPIGYKIAANTDIGKLVCSIAHC